MIPRLAYIFTATGVPASMVMSSSAMIGSSLPSSRITVPIFSPAFMICEIKGGLEYLFGTAQANKGSKNVALAFKRMTTPVVLLDENNQPYEGRAIVKLFLKNKGVQDLFSGKIEADPNAKPEYIDIRKVSEGITFYSLVLSEGILTNLIPQIIKAGEKIGTVILEDGKEEPIIAEEDITIEAGTPVAVKMYARRGIIDERTTLFR